MAYRPSLSEEAKSFYAWLQTQIGDYDYSDVFNCALARYAKALGYTRVTAGSRSITYGEYQDVKVILHPELYDGDDVICAALTRHKDFEALCDTLSLRL